MRPRSAAANPSQGLIASSLVTYLSGERAQVNDRCRGLPLRFNGAKACNSVRFVLGTMKTSLQFSLKSL